MNWSNVVFASQTHIPPCRRIYDIARNIRRTLRRGKFESNLFLDNGQRARTERWIDAFASTQRSWREMMRLRKDFDEIVFQIRHYRCMCPPGFWEARLGHSSPWGCCCCCCCLHTKPFFLPNDIISGTPGVLPNSSQIQILWSQTARKGKNKL